MYNILDLPAELLVFIISFLSSCDVVKLRYVSKSLRVFTEVPSVWRKFVWPYYRRSEKMSVIKVLKVFGIHIRRLSLTNYDDQLPPNLYCGLMLNTCTNVINLTLLTQVPLNNDKLKKILQHLKQLNKLEITWCGAYYPAILLERSNLTEVTLNVGELPLSLYAYQYWIQSYIRVGYRPRYVNVVQKSRLFHSVERGKYVEVLKWWSRHSIRDKYRPPNGYIAHFKIYSGCRVPFNLFPVLPDFHIQFSLTPLVKVNRLICCDVFRKPDCYSIFGQGYYSLKLNHCSCNDLSCKCVVVSASVDENVISYHDAAHRCQVDQHGVIRLTNDVSTDYVLVSVNDMKSVLDKDLEQLSFLIPNLQRLDLSYYDLSIHNMNGLCAVAKNCQNLKGLNLQNAHAVSLDLMAFWEILSGMKLTHLSIECCLITPAVIDNQPEMANLYETLQAIEINTNICEVCKNSLSEDLLCLSHFSSLLYCKLFHHDSYHSSVVQVIATSCKKLQSLVLDPKPFYQQSPFQPTGISLSSTCYNCLEQLSIVSVHTIVSDEFMESVSAHGGLIHVYLLVARITERGVGILIENSPKLIDLLIDLRSFDISTFQITYKKLYNCRLADTDDFTMTWSRKRHRLLLEYHMFNIEPLQDPDLFLWW